MVHVHAAASHPFGASVAMWFGMMAAMMAPTVWPWVRSFHRFGGPPASSLGATAQFAAGYLFTWFWYSVAAAAIQAIIPVPPLVAPVLLLAAGLFQFAPLKRACLTHCRNPFGFFLTRWSDGPGSAFRMGAEHGAYCVGCCWALMATPLALGTMSLWWMAVLAGVSFGEQVAPHGDRVRVAFGGVLVAAAVARFSGAA